MPGGIAGTIAMLISFVLTFSVARAISKWFRRRKVQRDLQKSREGESRQVRRARERRNRA